MKATISSNPYNDTRRYGAKYYYQYIGLFS